MNLNPDLITFKKNSILAFAIALGILSAAASLVSCRKDRILTNSGSRLTIGQDTIVFDTIFTTVGSTTKKFKIYNLNNGKINVSNIALEKGTLSNFRINVDGFSGTNFNDIEIAAGDSVFIFAEVTIDPNNTNNPMVVEDKILFTTNGNQQQIVLNAWGQDAYFHVKEIITENKTWANDKPHVIYGYCALDSAFTLTIPEGTRIHGHNSSYLLIYKSSLEVNGTPNNPVVFLQDRLEDYILSEADSVSGQWRGIYFFGAQNSTLNHVQIKNAVIGIQADTLTPNHAIQLNQVRIDNCVYASLLTQGANLNAVNCLFGNAGQFSGFISLGGNTTCDHCTFGNHWPGSRSSALFVLKDYYLYNNTIMYRPFEEAKFSNCIIYGPNDNEVLIDTVDRSIGGLIPNFIFDHCLVKTEDGINSSPFYLNCWKNSDPAFKKPGSWDFSLKSNSFAIDKANNSTTTVDLTGTPRTGIFDLGCFEF